MKGDPTKFLFISYQAKIIPARILISDKTGENLLNCSCSEEHFIWFFLNNPARIKIPDKSRFFIFSKTKQTTRINISGDLVGFWIRKYLLKCWEAYDIEQKIQENCGSTGKWPMTSLRSTFIHFPPNSLTQLAGVTLTEACWPIKTAPAIAWWPTFLEHDPIPAWKVTRPIRQPAPVLICAACKLAWLGDCLASTQRLGNVHMIHVYTCTLCQLAYSPVHICICGSTA